MMNKILGLIIFLMSGGMLQAGIVVDDANPLTFGSNLIEVGTDVLVTVTVNNVIIDFDEYVIAGGDTGILIPEGISGVTLRNGTVAQLTGTGIVIEQNCSNITIENMKFSQCASGVIELVGTSTDNVVKDIMIQDCTIQSCCLSSLSQNAIGGSYVRNLFLNDVRILNSGNSLATLSMVKFINSERCIFFTVGIAANNAFNFIGFDFINCETMLFRECRVTNNIADGTSGTLTGFSFTGTSCNNLLGESLILTNSAGSDVIGFDIDGNAESVTFGLGRIVGNYSNNGDIFGYRFKGSGTPSINKNSALANTVIMRNVTDGSGNIAAGIVIDRADQCVVDNCQILYQEASLGTAYGLLFTSSGGGDNWSIQENQFIKNIGSSDANSFGISVENGTDNLFIQNFAFDNGDTAVNQMNGVSTGSISELNPDNLNNAQTPWANVVVTG